jgi:glycerol-3-phosphate O-acyltransferase
VPCNFSCHDPLMMTTVELPIWVLILMMAFAAVAALDKILMPSVRWYLRRRLERAVERLNLSLTHPIQPFKLARRRDTVLRLVYDPEVAQAIVDHARTAGIREDVAAQKAERYAREIVPSFSAFAYFGFAIRVARFLGRSLYRVRLGHLNEDALAAIDPEATVVFVMNHRSNMDYVLVTWLVAERSALAYAVGEWARVWPLQQLVRALGGYFIRRRHNNPLYRKVLARYVQIATDNGLTQAIFPEGGLSQTGRVGPAKLGLFSYILDGYRPGTSRDVVFVPVALNYDRVMEDRVLVKAHVNGTRRFRFSLRPIWRYLWRQLWHRITGRFHRYGYAAVSFGIPLSLTSFLETPHQDASQDLGNMLMGRIRDVMPVVPLPLVAHALWQGIRDRDTLRAAVVSMIAQAQEQGAPVHVPRGDVDYTIEVGLRGLSERHMLSEREGRIEITEEGEKLVAFYACSVDHLFGNLIPDPIKPKSQRHKITK